ncbi:MAG: zinc ribbon domain-containing protein [Lachnospiraceae bacterium]|nr:zinc ribbon domain-containing protein [Lachnospiraceae bacterium]
MFIIWGSRSMDKTLGETQRTYQCQHCNNASRYRVFRRRNWFTLFWIPIFPFSSKYFITCPICNFGSKLKKQDALDLLQVPTELQQQTNATIEQSSAEVQQTEQEQQPGADA